MEERVLSEAASRGEDDFRSCCGDEEEWEDTEESFTAGVAKGELDEASVRLFFKGVSSPEPEGKKLSGIGVVMERSPGVPVLKVQKKLDFYVEELVAEHLALMDGLLVALQNGIRKIFAFTNSEKLYFQVRIGEANASGFSQHNVCSNAFFIHIKIYIALFFFKNISTKSCTSYLQIS
jgi:hypothetical protein